jgi:hypothetical protein
MQRSRIQSLREAILRQLAGIYGEGAAQPKEFFYQDWAREQYTSTAYDQPPMYEHPLYRPLTQVYELFAQVFFLRGCRAEIAVCLQLCPAMCRPETFMVVLGRWEIRV